MQQALAEELQCPVCLALFDDPVVLACPHSMCRACAVQLPVRHAAGMPTLTCPVCREATPIPNGVASLRRSVYLSNLVDQLRRHGEAPAAPPGPECGWCQDHPRRPATCGCLSCNLLFCQPCYAQLHAATAFAGHHFSDVETYQRAAQQARLVCEEHHKKLKLYCPQCVQLVCTLCAHFGRHKSHGCKPTQEAGDCLPALERMEAGLQSVAAETHRVLELLHAVRAEVETDGRESEEECRAFLRAIRDHTQQRLALVGQQEAALEEVLRRVAELEGIVPGARVEFPERLELHCRLVALARDVQGLEVPTPPLLRLRAGEAGAAALPGARAGGIVLPQLPAPSAGETFRCAPLVLHNVPEFNPEPPVAGLEYSCHNRHCHALAGVSGHSSAVARESFTSGLRQFTVHVLNSEHLMIGVATANAPRTGQPYHHGLFLHHNGNVYTLNGVTQPYTAANCIPAGCRVTMRLDFANRTAAYEVDGRDLGVVKAPLPEGPLFPAIISHTPGEGVEFIP